MAIFVDGLWISGLTLHIHRKGAPIPAGMQEDYIKINATPTQINAIAALLGLGFRNGDLLMYSDEDLRNHITKKEGFNFQMEYEAINSRERNERRSIPVVSPLNESKLVNDMDITRNGEMYFWKPEDVTKPISDGNTQPVDNYVDEEGNEYMDVPMYEGNIEYLEDEALADADAKPVSEEGLDDEED